MKRLILVLAAAACLGGCAGGFEPVGMERQRIAGLYSVEPQSAWSRQEDNRIEYWTIDGPTLDLLQFTPALKDSDSLYKIEGRENMPRFRQAMSESEVMEFVVDSLAAIGVQKIEASELRPSPFGPLPGFRFDLAFQSAGGLDMLGTVVGTIKGKDLYLIIYSGAALHYYPKHKSTAEAVIASIQI
jgi:hypothetical protein